MNLIRSLLFLAVFAVLLVLIDIAFVALFGFSFGLLFKLFDLKWYWILLVGGAAFGIFMGLANWFAALVAMITQTVCRISSHKMFAFCTVLFLAIINGLWLIWRIWASPDQYNLVAIVGSILFTLWSLGLLYGFILGAINYDERSKEKDIEERVKANVKRQFNIQ